MRFHCKFIDGPAAGVSLTLARGSLLMLRVVESPDGEWDALDLLTDKPRINETIHVYRAGRIGSRWHIKAVKKSQSGWFQEVEYWYWENPGDEHLRTQAAWAAWCELNKDQLESPD